MLSFLYLNKIAGITLAALSTALGAINGIDVDAVFSFIDDDLHTHPIGTADATFNQVPFELSRISNFCLIKQINVRIDNEVNICFISNGESFTAVFTSPSIEMNLDEKRRLKLSLNRISNPKALKLIGMLTMESIIVNGIYHANMLKPAK